MFDRYVIKWYLWGKDKQPEPYERIVESEELAALEVREARKQGVPAWYEKVEKLAA